jgi:RNA polymerase sigma-70 factor (ECF subfamily)
MATADDFDRFFDATRRRLVGQVFALTGDLHEAEDLTQEAFAKAAADWRRVRGYDAPEAWVRRVAFNLAANRRRRLARQARALVRLGPPADVPGIGVEELALGEALKALPPKQRAALVLHHVVGLPTSEVALELGVPSGTVRSWLSRARATLARTIGDQEPTIAKEARAANG